MRKNNFISKDVPCEVKGCHHVVTLVNYRTKPMCVKHQMARRNEYMKSWYHAPANHEKALEYARKAREKQRSTTKRQGSYAAKITEPRPAKREFIHRNFLQQLSPEKLVKYLTRIKDQQIVCVQ